MKVTSEGNIIVESDESLHLLSAGAEYGYPSCCRFHFWQMVSSRKCDVTPAEEALGFIGTGYRACPTCQGKTIGEVYRAIIAARTLALPFPIDCMDDLKNNHRYRAAVEEFIHRLELAGVAPEAELIATMKSIKE